MGIYHYQCEDCNDCLFDFWAYCDGCSRFAGNEVERICIDCFEEDKYDKKRLC